MLQNTYPWVSRTFEHRFSVRLTAGFHYCTVLLLWSTDSWLPLIGVSCFMISHCLCISSSKSPKCRTPTLSDLLTRVPLMNGSDLVRILRFAIPRCNSFLSSKTPIHNVTCRSDCPCGLGSTALLPPGLRTSSHAYTVTSLHFREIQRPTRLRKISSKDFVCPFSSS